MSSTPPMRRSGGHGTHHWPTYRFTDTTEGVFHELSDRSVGSPNPKPNNRPPNVSERQKPDSVGAWAYA